MTATTNRYTLESVRALDFWKAVTVDRSNLLDSLTALLAERQIRYCLIGGQAVNAYVSPVVSLDLDLVVAVDQLETAEALLRERFTVERFAHSIHVSLAGSDLRACRFRRIPATSLSSATPPIARFWGCACR